MKIQSVSQPIVDSKQPSTSYRDQAIAKLKQSMSQPVPETTTESIETSQVESPLKSTSSTDVAGREVITEEIDTTLPSTTLETVAEETKAVEETVNEDSISSQYAILARKQKQFREREKRIQAREQALKTSDEAKLVPPTPTFDESKYISRDRIAQDPLNALADLGISYDQITNLMLNQANPQQIQQDAYLRKLEAKISDLEQKQERTVKTFEEGQIEARSQAVRQISRDVQSLVTNDPSFELIKLTNNSAEVVKLIETTFDEDGTLLSIEEAAKEIEEALMERQFRISSSSQKIKQRLQSVASTQTATKQPVNQVKQPLKTLTNSVTSTRPLTARERALEAFKRPR